MTEINNCEDIIDSRDVIKRIDELQNMRDDEDEDYDDDAREELEALEALAEEASGYAADWQHGETLIRDSYFAEYAEQLADDIGATNKDAPWPQNHIDWNAAAEELKQDYTCVEFDGVDYWIR
jgi:hypothetical protein